MKKPDDLPWEIEECRKYLKSLKEDALRERILIPLFKAMAWDDVLSKSKIGTKVDKETSHVHGPNEPQHKCDILLIRHESGATSFEGIQAKKTDIKGATDVQEIKSYADIALHCPFKGSDGRTHCLNVYHWITTGDLETNGRTAICAYLDSPGSSTFRRVDVWDWRRLIDEIRRFKPDLLPPLKLLMLEQKAQEHQTHGKRSVFSSWYAYQAFRWYLRYKPEDLAAARRHLEQAQDWLLGDRHAALYFKRTLSTFYQMWIDLIDHAPSVVASGKFDPMKHIDRKRVRKVLGSKYPGTMYWLLSDISFMLEQLELLESRYANSPSGLSTLEICQLLLRATYPPETEGIAQRLQRLLSEELPEERGRSIDRQCSLCTGVAVSCFALANQKDRVKKTVKWLTGPRVQSARYAYHPDFYVGTSFAQHALHYSAAVLSGVLDYEYPRSRRLKRVLRVFFDGECEPDCPDAGWMKYRNIDRFEVYARILPALLRYLLAEFLLEPSDAESLQNVLMSLVKQLRAEAESLSVPTWKPYAARENLASLCLGFLLGVEEVSPLAADILAGFHRRTLYEANRPSRKKLLDSNVDRAVTFIGSCFLYWETLLAVEERRGKIERLLPEPEQAQDPGT